MQEYQYVIVGGGLAGGSAVEGIRAVDSEGTLLLLTQEPHRPYQRPPLSKDFLLGKAGLQDVYLESPDYYDENRVVVRCGVRVSDLKPDAKSVTLDDGSTVHYQQLLLALGATARRLSMPGNELPGVFTLRTIEDSKEIQRAAEKGKRALVLGGSFIGSEVASSLAQLGVETTLVFPEDYLLEGIAPHDMSLYLQARYAEHGVHLRPRTTAERLNGQDAVAQAILDNGETPDVDLVVMGVGVRLNTTLARNAGLEMDDEEAIQVDEMLRTSDPHIYAAGDIAAWPDPTFGRRLRVEHWDVAKNQGLRAGRNMAGESEPYTTLPYFFSDLFDLSFEVWGNLDAWDHTVLRGSLESDSFAYFYFEDGRMVGVLAVGRPDEEREAMQTLVKDRARLAEVAERLRTAKDL